MHTIVLELNNILITTKTYMFWASEANEVQHM